MRVRSLLSLLLASLLALTGAGAGFAHGAAPAAGAVVICNGDGIATILVDRDGQPVERHVLCPDCIATLIATGPDAPGMAPSVPAFRAAPRAHVTRAPRPARAGRCPPARAPPPIL